MTARESTASPAARRRWFVAALLLASGALTACAGAAQDPGPGPTRTPTGADALTPPGTTLAVGETATIPRAGDEGVVRVTVTDVVEAPASDLAPLERPNAGQETPYYVRYELEMVSGTSPYLPIENYLSGWAGHTPLDQVVPTQPFAPCRLATFSSGATPGTTVAGCAIYVTDRGAPPLDRVQLGNGDTYHAADGTNVSWE